MLALSIKQEDTDMKSAIRRLAFVMVLGLVGIGWVGEVAEAQVPNKVNYQGKLTDSAGQPINATVSVVFHLYNVASGGSALYTETQTVTVTNGLFNAAIGSVTPLGLPFDVPYYLGVKVGTDLEMTPRQAVLSSAYALQAASAEGLAATATVGGAQITGAISTATLPAGNLSGTIGTTQIASNAVTQAKLSPLSGGTAGKVLGTDGSNLVWQSAGSGGVTGSGSLNFLAKWTPGGSTLGNSAVFENNGLVGIGTNPAYTLDMFAPNAQIRLTNAVTGGSALLSRYPNRFEIQPNDGFQISVGGVAAPHFWVGAGGNVGIGTTAPANHVQIGSAPGFSGNDLAIGNGSKGMSFFQSPTASTWFSSANFALMPVGSTGLVGIGTTTPANKLQIGSVGASEFSGNDIAFGNGVQASAIAQTPSAAWWYSNTDIALMPRGDGHGRVGINTTTPGAALQVASYVQNSPNGYNYFKNHGGNDYELGYCAGCMANLSIDAEQNVLALEFDVQSDERIKNIVNTSDSGKDLDTINALQVTDYTLKDKAAHGNKPFKKVIAQQVETVYPQVVSKHVDFIPNVYQAASKVTKTDRGILLRFENGHHLTAQAKRIKLLASNEHTMQRVEIVSIPSERDVLIEATPLNGDKVFVYGEEVDDFRTVDYEGLTTLNISATQELSRQLTHQRADIAGIVTDEGAQLADLRQELANQTTRIVELERQTAEIVALKQERMAFQQQAAEITMLRQQMALVVELQEQAARLAAQTRLSSK
jgi:Chaperone of endosialidase